LSTGGTRQRVQSWRIAQLDRDGTLADPEYVNAPLPERLAAPGERVFPLYGRSTPRCFGARLDRVQRRS